MEPFRKRFFLTQEGDEDSLFEGLDQRTVLPFKLGGLLGGVGGATAPMSATELAQWTEVRAEVPVAIDDVNAFLSRLKPFYARLLEAGLYPAVPKAVPKP